MDLYGLTDKDKQLSDLNVRPVSLGEAEITAADLPRITIIHGMRPSEQWDKSNYWIFPCFTGSRAASEVSVVSLHSGGERRTCGYIFPITALRNEADEDDPYIQRYAETAFRGLISPDIFERYQSSISWSEAADGDAYLDELIDDDLSVGIVWKRALNDAKIEQDDLWLSMLRAGVNTDTADLKALGSGPVFDPGHPIKVTASKISEKADKKKLLRILRNADADASAIGKFIQLYQSIEYMIGRIFVWGIEEARRTDLDPWAMKELLSSITQDKKRLERLSSKCLPTLSNPQSRSLLRDECEQLLKHIGIDEDGNRHWHDLLYRVRGIVVHNQFTLLDDECISHIQRINQALRMCVFDLLMAFEKPEDKTIFSDADNAKATGS